VVKSETEVQATQVERALTAPEAATDPVPEVEGPSSGGLRAEEAPRPARRRRRRRQRKADLSRVQAGQQYQGRVVGLAKFGAFVDIGMGRDALLHISELRKGFVNKVDSALAVGDEVSVWVKSVDQQRNRISLTMIEPPTEARSLSELQPGMVLKGKVESVAPFGAFVDVGAPVNGLVHISEMAEGYVRKPQSVVSPGDDVEVRVLQVDAVQRKISLSMRGLHTATNPSRGDRASTLTAMEYAWQQALAARKAGQQSQPAASPKNSSAKAVQSPRGHDES